MNELTGRELDVALARALGWRPLEVAGQWHITREYGGTSEVMPLYHESLDALIRDVLPKCLEQGVVGWFVGSGLIRDHAQLWDDTNTFYGDGDTPALALARACLSALEATK